MTIASFNFIASGSLPTREMRQAINQHFLDSPSCNEYNEIAQLVAKQHVNMPLVEKAHYNLPSHLQFTVSFDLSDTGHVSNLKVIPPHHNEVLT
jgi:hypothetical protein